MHRTDSPADAQATLQAILQDSDLPETLAKALPGDPMQVTVHRLSNGLTVYISPDPSAPRVHTQIGVRAGSRHDPADSTGLAHYLEHMLFKGTDQLGTLDYANETPALERIARLYRELRGASESERDAIVRRIDAATVASADSVVPNEFERLYGALGIVGINAYTNDDSTVYHCEVPAYQLSSWATVEAERFADPVFRLFYPELEAVYEEKNISLDDPTELMSDRAYALLFPAHPYGTQRILGSVEHLRTPAFDDMTEFYGRWYAPNNMAIALVGDVDADTVIPMLERTFSRWQPRALPEHVPGVVTPLKARQHATVTAPGEQAVSLLWTLPAAHEADALGLGLLDEVLGNGTSGLLDLHLVLPQKVPGAGSYHHSMTEAGAFLAYAAVRQDQDLDAVEAMLLAEVARLREGDFSQEMLDGVVLHAEIAEAYVLEDAEARADELMDSFVTRVPWREMVSRGDRRRDLTKADLVRLANKYLGPDGFVSVHLVQGKNKPPELGQPTATPIEIDPSRRSPFAAEISQRSVAPPAPVFLRKGVDFAKTQLPSGSLTGAQNTLNDLFSVSYSWPFGEGHDALLCHALELFELSGTPTLSAAELATQLYGLGAQVKVDCDGRDTAVHILGVERNFEATLELVRGWIAAPTVPQATLDALLASTLSMRADAMRDPETIGSALGAFARYGKRSPFLTVASNKQLKAASRAKLWGRIKRLRETKHTTAYFGPRTLAGAKAYVDLGPAVHELPKPQSLGFVRPKKPRVLMVHQDTAKSVVWSVLPSPKPVTGPGRAMVEAWQFYLNGDSTSAFYQELREARGLVYNAGGWFLEAARPEDETAMLGYFAAGSDKVRAAARLMLSLFREPVSQERMTEALAVLKRRFRLDRSSPREVAYDVLAWELQGLTGDPRVELWDGLSGLSPAQVAAFAREQAQTPTTLAVVGDLPRIGDLAEFGEVVTLTPKQLFGY